MTRNERFVLPLVLVLAVLSGCSWFLPSNAVQILVFPDADSYVYNIVGEVSTGGTIVDSFTLEAEPDLSNLPNIVVQKGKRVTVSAAYEGRPETKTEISFMPIYFVPGRYVIRVQENNQILSLSCDGPDGPQGQTPGCDDVQNKNP